MGWPDGIAFSPDGTMIVSTSVAREDDVMVHLWDAETGERMGRLTVHEDRVRDVAFSPDGMTLATASDDGTVLLWDTGTWKPMLTLVH